MWTKTPDGSVVDDAGKVIFFSANRFERDIGLGGCCFICGAIPNGTAFNDEHVLPEWLLRRYGLFNRTIGLPNESKVRYGSYTVPCCAACNALMGSVIEEPISKVVRDGSNAICDFAADGSLLKLFVWMGLIFLKTHLKDRAHRVHLDTRKGTQKIADDYDWADLHHIHSVVRCFYTGTFVEQEAIGSFLSLPVRAENTTDRFDYADLYAAQTMFVRLDDTALFAVFNDSGGAMSYFSSVLDKITGPLSDLQLREVLVELAYLNLHLKERPQFATEYDCAAEQARIVAFRPELELESLDRRMRGQMLYNAVHHALNIMRVPGVSPDDLPDAIKKGDVTFLWDKDGNFMPESGQFQQPS